MTRLQWDAIKPILQDDRATGAGILARKTHGGDLDVRTYRRTGAQKLPTAHEAYPAVDTTALNTGHVHDGTELYYPLMNDEFYNWTEIPLAYRVLQVPINYREHPEYDHGTYTVVLNEPGLYEHPERLAPPRFTINLMGDERMTHPPVPFIAPDGDRYEFARDIWSFSLSLIRDVLHISGAEVVLNKLAVTDPAHRADEHEPRIEASTVYRYIMGSAIRRTFRSYDQADRLCPFCGKALLDIVRREGRGRDRFRCSGCEQEWSVTNFFCHAVAFQTRDERQIHQNRRREQHTTTLGDALNNSTHPDRYVLEATGSVYQAFDEPGGRPTLTLVRDGRETTVPDLIAAQFAARSAPVVAYTGAGASQTVLTHCQFEESFSKALKAQTFRDALMNESGVRLGLVEGLGDDRGAEPIRAILRQLMDRADGRLHLVVTADEEVKFTLRPTYEYEPACTDGYKLIEHNQKCLRGASVPVRQ